MATYRTDPQFAPGQRVTYVTEYGKLERGIIKLDDGDCAFVVYHCDGNWDRYAEYTAARTHKRDLVVGWKERPAVPNSP